MLAVAEADSIAAGTSDNSDSQTVSGFFPGPFSRMTAASRCAGAARAPWRSGPLPSDQCSAADRTRGRPRWAPMTTGRVGARDL